MDAELKVLEEAWRDRYSRSHRSLRKVARRVTEQDPKDPKVLESLVGIFSVTGDDKELVHWAERWLEVCPEEEAPLYELFLACLRMKDFERAEAIAERYRRLGEAECYWRHYELAWWQQDHEAALAWALLAAQAEEFVFSYDCERVARSFENLDQDDHAEMWLRLSIDSVERERDSGVWVESFDHALAECYERLLDFLLARDRVEDVDATLEALLRHGPRARSFLLLAKVEQQLGRAEEAEANAKGSRRKPSPCWSGSTFRTGRSGLGSRSSSP